jgi:hypothetical protein
VLIHGAILSNHPVRAKPARSAQAAKDRPARRKSLTITQYNCSNTWRDFGENGRVTDTGETPYTGDLALDDTAVINYSVTTDPSDPSEMTLTNTVTSDTTGSNCPDAPPTRPAPPPW